MHSILFADNLNGFSSVIRILDFGVMENAINHDIQVMLYNNKISIREDGEWKYGMVEGVSAETLAGKTVKVMLLGSQKYLRIGWDKA